MINSVDIVIWDFDGVINRNYDGTGFLWHRHLETDLGFPFSSLQKDLFGEPWPKVLRGETQINDLLSNCLAKVGHSGSAESFLDYWMARDFFIDCEIVKIIGELRDIGKIQAVATNNEPHRTQVLWSKHGLCDLCHHLFSSGQMGVLKPEPAFFSAVEENLRVPAQRLLLIDDTPKNIEVALQRGWQAILCGDSSRWELGSSEQLRQTLGLTYFGYGQE